MNKDALEDLSEKIASGLAAAGARAWLPVPVRPAPPGRPTAGALPTWAGAAQSLSDVAPVRRAAGHPRNRADYPAMVVAERQAAAGRGPSPLPSGSAAGVAAVAATGRPGSCSHCAGKSAVSANSTHRSMTLRSSRTFPGQL